MISKCNVIFSITMPVPVIRRSRFVDSELFEFIFHSEVLHSVRTAPVIIRPPERTPVQRSMSSTCRPARIGRAPRKKNHIDRTISVLCAGLQCCATRPIPDDGNAMSATDKKYKTQTSSPMDYANNAVSVRIISIVISLIDSRLNYN